MHSMERKRSNRVCRRWTWKTKCGNYKNTAAQSSLLCAIYMYHCLTKNTCLWQTLKYLKIELIESFLLLLLLLQPLETVSQTATVVSSEMFSNMAFKWIPNLRGKHPQCHWINIHFSVGDLFTELSASFICWFAYI